MTATASTGQFLDRCRAEISRGVAEDWLAAADMASDMNCEKAGSNEAAWIR